MSVTVKELPWARVEVDASKGFVRVMQRWGYQWSSALGAPAWKQAEKEKFHEAIVKLVTSRIVKKKLNVSSKHQCLLHPKMDLVFDIGWALEKYKHWTVLARKLPKSSTPTTLISQVDWSKRVILLDSADVDDYHVCNAAKACRNFNAVPHEFVHTLQGPDEYNPVVAHLDDTDSILNIGNQLRQRHVKVLLTELNKMIPGWTFTY